MPALVRHVATTDPVLGDVAVDVHYLRCDAQAAGCLDVGTAGVGTEPGQFAMQLPTGEVLCQPTCIAAWFAGTAPGIPS